MLRPSAILCDVEGTLFHPPKGEWSRLSAVDMAVVNLLEGMSFARRWRTILVSDRTERSRDELTAFLGDVGIRYDALYLRSIDNTHSTVGYKRWVYDFLVAPQYQVQLVLEDDPAVAKVFRTLNVPCFLVGEWMRADHVNETPPPFTLNRGGYDAAG